MNAAKITPLRPRTPLIVLVVEDEVLTRLAVADELRASGYRVLEASSAEDAIAILESMPVHVLFVDINLPGLRDGRDVARMARARRPAPKILLTSGKLGMDEIDALEELGPFIPKPYPTSRVIELIDRALDPTDDTRS